MINKLKEWFNHLTIPRQELSNMPICPFAKAAVANQEYTIEETNLDDIAFQISNANVQVYKVCIFYLPNYETYEVEALEAKTRMLNRNFMPTNKVVLDSDPRNPFVINGIKEFLSNEPDKTFKDIAILVRANSHLEPFVLELKKERIIDKKL